MEEIATASEGSTGDMTPDLPNDTYGYNGDRQVKLDSLHEFIPLYAEAVLNSERKYKNTEIFDEDGETWDIMGVGAGTPLRVREGVHREHIFNLFENSMEEQLTRSWVEVLEDTLREKTKASAKVGGGVLAAVGGGYIAVENGEVEALRPIGDALSPVVDVLEPFASEAALAGAAAVLDGGWEIQNDFNPDRYFEELKEDALDHLYIVDVDYHERDLGEIDRLVERHGTEYLEEENIMSEGQYEMMKKWWEEDEEPVRLLFTVWDPTEDRRMVQHVLNEYFDDYGDPKAVYSRGFY
ncbi:MAG: hypothetical protein ABEI07_00010 [Candidatus Nanohaloarchaea archaeon]